MSAVLRNSHGTEVHVICTGAVIQRLLVPDKAGNVADIVLGFDEVAPYQDGTSPYFGAVVGRVANRIAGAAFELDGERYQLAANNGPNCLHGGVVGFSRKEWAVDGQGDGPAGQWAKLTCRSPGGEEGFPGAVVASVTYTLSPSNELTMEMAATADAPTPLNLAQHSYFNLGGHSSGDVLGHELTIDGDHYLPVDDVQIPTGEIAAVAGTPFDFTSAHTVGERIDQVPAAPPGGYDHNLVLFGLGPQAKDKVLPSGMAFEEPRLAATLRDPRSGRKMQLFTNAPGVQFYSGNFLDGSLVGKGGALYGKHAALCLETQGFPDAVNQPNFPTVILRPGMQYRHVVKYQFSAD